MEPQPTVVEPPIQLRIADDLRMKIERGDLQPGESLPTLQQICEDWNTSPASARAAIALLKQQGLISGGRGKAPVVRIPPRPIVRSSSAYQIEKDLVHKSEQDRARVGAAELDMGLSLDDLSFSANFAEIPADYALAEAFGIEEGAPILRRIYETSDPRTGRRQSWSVSYLRCDLIAANEDLLDESKARWPGGTQHQLSTVGIEVDHVRDLVTARMPTTADAQRWGLDDGVPMLHTRRFLVDTEDRVVEISDAQYPADRTELEFTTILRGWAE